MVTLADATISVSTRVVTSGSNLGSSSQKQSTIAVLDQPFRTG